jgi:4-hydroxybenzoate polyprenyltransferase
LSDNPYFQLLRIPNIFTVPPDIILGYLIALSSVQLVNLESIGYYLPNMIILVISSISLYLGGLVSNDLFDTKTDMMERPGRPLPSGKIQRSYAYILLILFFGAGFSLSLLLNPLSVGISGLLIISILLYNYKLKNGLWRPFLMGGIRALNILFGFSILFSFSDQSVNNMLSKMNSGNIVETQSLLLLLIVLFSVFFHIFVLTYVSSRETAREFNSESNKKRINIKIILYTYTIFLFINGLIGFYLVENKTFFVIFILVLGVIVVLIFYHAHRRMHHLEANIRLQFLVKNMIILLVLLDSAFIAGISGPLVGITTASLILPSIYLSKKIAMT